MPRLKVMMTVSANKLTSALIIRSARFVPLKDRDQVLTHLSLRSGPLSCLSQEGRSIPNSNERLVRDSLLAVFISAGAGDIGPNPNILPFDKRSDVRLAIVTPDISRSPLP